MRLPVSGSCMRLLVLIAMLLASAASADPE
jgi:hypothetical protein